MVFLCVMIVELFFGVVRLSVFCSCLMIFCWCFVISFGMSGVMCVMIVFILVMFDSSIVVSCVFLCECMMMSLLIVFLL